MKSGATHPAEREPGGSRPCTCGHVAPQRHPVRLGSGRLRRERNPDPADQPDPKDLHGGVLRHFSQLFSFNVLDSVPGIFGLGHADDRVVRSDPEVAASEYDWRDLADHMRVGRLFDDGATIIFARRTTATTGIH